jgi:prevent-host-death family protein
MTEIGSFEAKNKLSELLHRVERGEEVVITRRGKPIAKLAPIVSTFDRGRARKAAADILERNHGRQRDRSPRLARNTRPGGTLRLDTLRRSISGACPPDAIAAGIPGCPAIEGH